MRKSSTAALAAFVLAFPLSMSAAHAADYSGQQNLTQPRYEANYRGPACYPTGNFTLKVDGSKFEYHDIAGNRTITGTMTGATGSGELNEPYTHEKVNFTIDGTGHVTGTLSLTLTAFTSARAFCDKTIDGNVQQAQR